MIAAHLFAPTKNCTANPFTLLNSLITSLRMRVPTQWFGAAGLGGIGGRLGPVRAATDARGLEPGFVERVEHSVLLHMAHRLHALEAGAFDGLELLQHRSGEGDRGIHDRLANG